MAELLPYIFNAIVIAGLMYLAWRDGFGQGRATATRRNLKLKARVIRLDETMVGIDNRIDGIEAKLNTAEKLLKVAANNVYGCKNIDALYADDKPYDIASWYPDTSPETETDGYKFRCEPDVDDYICESCTHKGTSVCYGCGFNHELYEKNTEKPEDWSCDTCVHDDDMHHFVCRQCHEGTCYIKKEDTHKIVVKGTLPSDAVDCEVVKEE